MRRREFIAFLGGAAGWPLTARAQQTEKPVIGFLDGRLPDAIANRLRGFHRGLREAGYVEGENVTVLYRYAENHNDRLPGLAAELTRQAVACTARFFGFGCFLHGDFRSVGTRLSLRFFGRFFD